MRRLQLVILAVGSLAGAARAAESPPLRLAGATMGTTWAVQVARPAPELVPRRLERAVARRLAAIDRRMSTYRPDSEVSRFNASRSTAWTPVSADTRRVLAEALAVSRLSTGAFDPTVEPLVTLWGFGPAGPPHRPPPGAIEAARAAVGFGRLRLRAAGSAVRKLRPDLGVDLSAIAKGFAVDAVAALLERRGVRDYLVEIGGELRGRGHGPGGAPWTVAVEQPDGGRDAAVAVIRLDGAAVATSGDYRQWFAADGTRFSHVLDPRTGAPIAHELAAVTVVAPTAMRADALATALLVLGPEAGRALARRHGLAAAFVERTAGGLRTSRTTAFARHAVAAPGTAG